MASKAPHADPSAVSVEEGEVLVDGPDGVAVAMTADAAEETGKRLLKAAAEARDQTAGDDDLRRAG